MFIPVFIVARLAGSITILPIYLLAVTLSTPDLESAKQRQPWKEGFCRSYFFSHLRQSAPSYTKEPSHVCTSIWCELRIPLSSATLVSSILPTLSAQIETGHQILHQSQIRYGISQSMKLESKRGSSRRFGMLLVGSKILLILRIPHNKVLQDATKCGG